LALLLPQHESAREGVRPAKMLVRALKLLGHFLSETTGRDIATAALISRAMKVALMTEPNQIGNDEPENRIV